MAAMKQRIVVDVLKLVKRFVVDPEFRATVLQLRAHREFRLTVLQTLLQDHTIQDFAGRAIPAVAANRGVRILMTRLLDRLAEDPANGGLLEKVLGLDPALWAVAVQLRDAGPGAVAETKPGRISASTLFQVLQAHPGAMAKVNRVLESLRRADRIALFDYLDRWLAHRPADFQRVVEAEFASSETPPGLTMALADWANRETLRVALSRSRMRAVYLRELFPAAAEVSVPVGVIHEESHHANKVDMAYVCAIAAARGAKTIFEFGTYRGQTTIALAGISDHVRVHTLNLPPEDDPRYAPYIGQFIETSPHRARITQLFVHSSRLDTTPYAQSMDFIFIDGDHSYEMVKNDTEKALQMLRPGGTIVWHDYAAKTAGVVDYLREFSQDRPLFHIRNTCLAVFMEGVDAETMSLSAMPPSLEAEEVSPDGRPLRARRTPPPALQADRGPRRTS